MNFRLKVHKYDNPINFECQPIFFFGALKQNFMKGEFQNTNRRLS